MEKDEENKKGWYNLSCEEVTKKLDTNIKLGLTQEEVRKRQEKYGYNQLEEGKKKSLFIKFLEYLFFLRLSL